MRISLPFAFNASRGVRKQVITEIKKGAFLHGLDIEIKELGGTWLEKEYGATVSGEEKSVNAFRKALEAFIAGYNKEIDRVNDSTP